MKRFILIIAFLFVISRIYVLMNPPYIDGKDGQPSTGYSDVKQDSERYANMWYYGLTPYRKHLYEYPPIAIPFVYIPLLVDQAGYGHYYQNYRVEIFLFECVLFIMMSLALQKIWKGQPFRVFFALAFYCVIGAIGKDFWYDGLDLLFIGFFTLGLITRYLAGNQPKMWHRVLFWALFSASFGIKYMTAPLAFPLFWMWRKEWKKELVAGMLGFLLVWGAPIIMYRSSLSVMVFFHTVRPLKYESLGTWVVLAINDFSHTEVRTNILPHLPIVGPVSSVVQKIAEVLFPLSIFGSIGWGIYLVHENRKRTPIQELRTAIMISLLYFMAIFLSNKVFSRPFHLWYIPLIILLPEASIKEQLFLMFGATWAFILDTTTWIVIDPALRIGKIFIIRVRDFARFVPLFGFLGYSIKKLNTTEI